MQKVFQLEVLEMDGKNVFIVRNIDPRVKPLVTNNLEKVCQYFNPPCEQNKDVEQS